MQVLTTNLQTNGIIAGLNINWPNSLRSIQNVFNVVQSSMVNTVSMDCSLQYWDSQIMSQAQIEAVIAMLIPIGMLGVFIIMWTCRLGFPGRYTLQVAQCKFGCALSCMYVLTACTEDYKSKLDSVLLLVVITTSHGTNTFSKIRFGTLTHVFSLRGLLHM